MLADPEADVAPGAVVRLEDAAPGDVRQVRLGQVRRAAEQLGQRAGQGVDGLLAGLAGGRAVAGGVARQALVPALGQAARQAPLQLRGFGRVRGGVAGQLLAPLGDELLAGRDGLAILGQRLVRDEELLVRIPAVGQLGAANLVLAQRRAVGLLRVVLGGRAESDVGSHGDQAGPLVGSRRLDGRVDCRHVVAVRHALGVPTVRVEAGGHVLREGQRGWPVELDVVVVVEDDELAQAQVPGQGSGLGADPLLEVAVGADGVDVVVEQLEAGPVEARGRGGLGDRHANGVGEALAQRPGGRLDAGGVTAFRVSGRARAELPEGLQVVERQAVAGQIEERVDQHAGVAGRQDEPVAAGPGGIGRGVAQVAGPERVGHRGHAHGGAGVARVRLLDGVHGQRPDRVDCQLVQLPGEGCHSGLSCRPWRASLETRPGPCCSLMWAG